ncbi:ABC transporter ATP-binding protein [Shimia sp.]|uniref:ABC transporter ATP-binding protein n=1 Tax=unclassified Shimia TaxID=2630038 RepID=UPI0025EB848B|nr:ABC transporter ATP-binding protein [Shimia sp.]MCH2066716.1 ABC transporter ATP-binding protein [Shimia sp.]
MLRLEGVSAGYGRAQVLREVSFEARPGEILCLVGRNGAGKTTTVKAIMGLLPLMAGAVRLGDVLLSDLAPHKVPQQGIGYVPQGRRLFGELTVGENLAVGRLTNGKDASVLEEVLQLFPRLEERYGQRANTLSGGEQQMLAMGRAMCLRPKVLLLDEPTEGLQPSMIEAIRDATEQMRDQGVAVVLVEQRMDAIVALADQVALLENGRMCGVLSRDAVATEPKKLAHHLGV